MEKKKSQKIKPIAIAIAIILTIIALTFGESKYLVQQTAQASITFSKTNFQNVKKNQGYKN